MSLTIYTKPSSTSHHIHAHSRSTILHNAPSRHTTIIFSIMQANVYFLHALIPLPKPLTPQRHKNTSSFQPPLLTHHPSSYVTCNTFHSTQMHSFTHFHNTFTPRQKSLSLSPFPNFHSLIHTPPPPNLISMGHQALYKPRHSHNQPFHHNTPCLSSIECPSLHLSLATSSRTSRCLQEPPPRQAAPHA